MLPLTDSVAQICGCLCPLHHPAMLVQWCSNVQTLCNTFHRSIFTVTSFKFLYLSYCTSFLIEVPTTILDSGKPPPSVIMNILCTELTMFMDLECHRSLKQWSWPQGPSEIPFSPQQISSSSLSLSFPFCQTPWILCFRNIGSFFCCVIHSLITP